MIICYTDGLCKKSFEGGLDNPGGIATYAYLIRTEMGQILFKDMGVIGEGNGMDHMIAEYTGLVEGLSRLVSAKMASEAVEIRNDNCQLIRQMRGEQKATKGTYIDKYLEASKLASEFAQMTFAWVPSEQNEADPLTWQVYRQYLARREGSSD